MSTSLRNNRLAALALLAFALVVSSIALVSFYAPVDADGLNQKIFYFHVPIALTPSDIVLGFVIMMAIAVPCGSRSVRR